MKLKICLMAALCLFFQAKSWSEGLTNALYVGDKVPDITINKILGYPGGSAKISDFKDKLLILDFWATWCTVCIGHFPESYAIQQKFPAEVQVLLVNSKPTRDTEAGIVNFLDKRKAAYHFPCAVADTVLDKFFPHLTLPHYVVIRNNVVLAITDAEHINESSISQLLGKTNTLLFVKKDVRLKKDQALFSEGNGGALPQNFYRTIITGRLPVSDSPNRFQTDASGSVTRIFAVNVNLYTLYAMAYPEYPGFPDCRILYCIPHPEKFVKNPIDSADRGQRFFSYESIFPPVTRNEAVSNMKTDLYRYFRLRVDTEYRDTICYVLHLDSDHPPKKVLAGTKREMNISENSNIPKFLHDFEIETLRNELEGRYSVPFFDETCYHANISLDLPANILDEQKLTKSLKKQGLILTRENRPVSYLVFRQN